MAASARNVTGPLRRRRMAACALTAAAAAAAPAALADVRITPRLTVEGSYTDNVLGAPRGQEEGDFFTTVSPGVNIVSRGGRFEGALDYSLIYEEYLDTEDLGGFSNALLGTSRSELWDERLFFDSSVSLQRVTANRRGAITATQRDVGGNQTEVLNYRLGPFMRLDFAGFAVSTTRYDFAQTIYDPIEETSSADATNFGTRPLNIANATTNSFQQTFESGRDFTQLAWSLDLRHDETERDGGSGVTRDATFKQRSAIAGAEYRINRYVSVLGSAGYEDIEDNSITREDPSGAVYSAGLRLTGARSQLRFEVGRRFGDPSFSYDAQYRFSPGLTFNSFYSEAVTTQSRTGQGAFDALIVDENGNFIDPRTGLPFQPNDPAFDLTDEDDAFRSRTFGNGLVGRRGRNTYALSAFYTTRESLNVDREQKVTGLTARVGRALWRHLNGDLSASFTDTQDDAAGDQELVRFNAALNYVVAEDLTATLAYTRLDRRGDSSGANDVDLRENLVTVRVVKVF